MPYLNFCWYSIVLFLSSLCFGFQSLPLRPRVLASNHGRGDRRTYSYIYISINISSPHCRCQCGRRRAESYRPEARTRGYGHSPTSCTCSGLCNLQSTVFYRVVYCNLPCCLLYSTVQSTVFYRVVYCILPCCQLNTVLSVFCLPCSLLRPIYREQ